ncbi:helix-turn-helix domain-containing protein [Botrimarina mediterranea]|uniref:HTH cro/C1-type domain-containing protein n=1 Tax=Botrimarina mediterranea TaxID=2528022 RepID=A0A518KD40_9BACT|nr:hypothetical protein [Botrimarina mediterranea]QDV75698.1 hypothetical protein Spa11_39190 [Botrimarina mediterranea]
MSAKRKTIEDVLRERLAGDPASYYAIAKATGITHPTLMRFAKGKGGLRLSVAAKLAEHYHLELRERQE